MPTCPPPPSSGSRSLLLASLLGVSTGCSLASDTDGAQTPGSTAVDEPGETGQAGDTAESGDTAERGDTAESGDTGDSGLDILWVGAHPDDEAILAPLLGARCVEEGLRCGLLLLTRGEAGSCHRPEVCADADIAKVRAAELEASASLLHARLEQWNLGDGSAGSPEGVLAAWGDRSGGREALVSAMDEALERLDPTSIITFDPRHGSSCHPDHRAAADLVMAATARLGAEAPLILFVESVFDDTLAPDQIGFRPAVPDDDGLVRFDATVHLDSVDDQAWAWLVLVLQAHASQFTDTVIDGVRDAADDQRATWWIEATAADPDDPRYANLCSDLLRRSSATAR